MRLMLGISPLARSARDLLAQGAEAAFVDAVALAALLVQVDAGQASSLDLSPTASGGTAPYVWSATGLPPGWALSPTGLLTGIGPAAGDYPVAFRVEDATTAFDTVTATLVSHELVAARVGEWSAWDAVMRLPVESAAYASSVAMPSDIVLHGDAGFLEVGAPAAASDTRTRISAGAVDRPVRVKADPATWLCDGARRLAMFGQGATSPNAVGADGSLGTIAWRLKLPAGTVTTTIYHTSRVTARLDSLGRLNVTLPNTANTLSAVWRSTAAVSSAALATYVVQIDCTQAVEADRCKVFIDGVAVGGAWTTPAPQGHVIDWTRSEYVIGANLAAAEILPVGAELAWLYLHTYQALGPASFPANVDPATVAVTDATNAPGIVVGGAAGQTIRDWLSGVNRSPRSGKVDFVPVAAVPIGFPLGAERIRDHHMRNAGAADAGQWTVGGTVSFSGGAATLTAGTPAPSITQTIGEELPLPIRITPLATPLAVGVPYLITWDAVQSAGTIRLRVTHDDATTTDLFTMTTNVRRKFQRVFTFAKPVVSIVAQGTTTTSAGVVHEVSVREMRERVAQARHDAQGWGRFARGGRVAGAEIVRVTTPTEAALRAALMRPNLIPGGEFDTAGDQNNWTSINATRAHNGTAMRTQAAGAGAFGAERVVTGLTPGASYEFAMRCRIDDVNNVGGANGASGAQAVVLDGATPLWTSVATSRIGDEGTDWRWGRDRGRFVAPASGAVTIRMTATATAAGDRVEWDHARLTLPTPRYVLMDCEGEIALSDELVVDSSDITFDCRRAPGLGAWIVGGRLKFEGSRVVLLGLRIYAGSRNQGQPTAARDALDIGCYVELYETPGPGLATSGCYVEYGEYAGGLDETFTLIANANQVRARRHTATDITVRRNIIAEGLNIPLNSVIGRDADDPPHSAALLYSNGLGRVSILDNLLGHSRIRNPQVAEESAAMEFLRNIVANPDEVALAIFGSFGAHGGVSGSQGWPLRARVQQNIFLAGPATNSPTGANSRKAVSLRDFIAGDAFAYVDGNLSVGRSAGAWDEAGWDDGAYSSTQFGGSGENPITTDISDPFVAPWSQDYLFDPDHEALYQRLGDEVGWKFLGARHPWTQRIVNFTIAPTPFQTADGYYSGNGPPDDEMAALGIAVTLSSGLLRLTPRALPLPAGVTCAAVRVRLGTWAVPTVWTEEQTVAPGVEAAIGVPGGGDRVVRLEYQLVVAGRTVVFPVESGLKRVVPA